MAMVLQSTGAYIFIILNSFIHSLMYFYYACSVLKIKIPFKHILTQMQMIQFVVGNSVAVLQVYFFGDYITMGDKICIWYHVGYTAVLFILFSRFYKKTYKKSKQQ